MFDAVLSRPLLFGHRGGGGEAPENTMPAFNIAREAGMDGIELDVLRCASGELVVVHDLTLKRVAGRAHSVQSLSWDEIKRIDVGSHFGSRFKGERVPRFEEVLEEFGREMLLAVELKGRRVKSDGIELEVIRALVSRGFVDNVILNSFNPVTLSRLRRLDQRFRIGFNYLGDAIEPLRRLWFKPLARPYSIHPPPRALDDELVETARRWGAKLMPWAVNEPEDVKRMLELGAAAIMSDYPSRLKSLAGLA